MNNIKLAALNLLRNRRRSTLSLLIIAVAIMALMVSGGFGLYTYESLQEAAARENGHITFSEPGFFGADEDYPLQKGLQQHKTLRQTVLHEPDVKAALPRIEFSGLISNGDKTAIFTGQGITLDEFQVKGPFLSLTSGKMLNHLGQEHQSQIMLGQDLARNLKLKVGDEVTLLSTTSEGTLNAIDFTLQGTFSSGIPELDKRQLFIPLASAQQLLDSDKVSTLSVFAYHTEQTAELLTRLGAQHPTLELTPWWKRAFFYDKVKNLYNLIFAVMGMILTLLVFVALYNTLTMSVTERTREIGTLKALGTSNRELMVNFGLEALLLALLGALLGLLLAGGISLLAMVTELQMPPPPGRSNGYPLYIYFSSTLALFTTVGICLICVFTSLLAARKGINKPITEALVYV